MNNKKPLLSDYGLTKKQIEDNEYAKKNRQRIINENQTIDEKSVKYGWIGFFVCLGFSIIIGLNANIGDYSLLFVIISGLIGYGICKFYQSTKQNVPSFNKNIDDKYQKYLNDLKIYNNSLKEKPLNTTSETTKPKTNGLNNNIQIQKESKSSTSKQTQKNENKQKKYSIGMVVKHPKYGQGTIKSVNNTTNELVIYFEDSLTYKKFIYTLVDFEIISEPKTSTIIKEPPKPKTKSQPQPTENSIIKEPIYYTYQTSKINLTKNQYDIFQNMFNISKKYCMDLEIDDRNSITGVGLPHQERLRFYISQKHDKIYIKFTDQQRLVPLDEAHKSEIIELTNIINNKFEENPEKYQLYEYKNILNDNEKEKTVENDTNSNDIFNTDGDYDEDDVLNNNILDKTEQSSDLIYDVNQFEINGTILIKFIGKNSNQSKYEIPNGITQIASYSFSDNRIVYDLIIPKTVKTIEDFAFSNCKKLHTLIIPATVEQIGKHVFDGCDNLDTLFVETKALKNMITDLPKHIELVCLEF